MKTPREILLAQHQGALPQLDALRAAVVADIARPPAMKTTSWRDMVLSLRWHLAGLSAAWIAVLLLNTDGSRDAARNVAGSAKAEPRQVWASLRENRRLLLQYTEAPATEPSAAPGRRSEIQPEQIEV